MGDRGDGREEDDACCKLAVSSGVEYVGKGGIEEGGTYTAAYPLSKKDFDIVRRERQSNQATSRK
jgi:hypothetical protein